VIEHGALPTRLNAAADILETHFEEVIAAYEERLLATGSPLIVEAKTHEQVMTQARSVLKEVTTVLRRREILRYAGKRSPSVRNHRGFESQQ
jgi:hypothetical protein